MKPSHLSPNSTTVNSSGLSAHLDVFRPVADAIAKLFAPYTEVVLHDLESQKVVHISNNLSRRAIGDDSALENISSHDSGEDVIGPYKNISWEGRNIHSISSILRCQKGIQRGLMCINFYISDLEEAARIISFFTSSTALVPKPERLFEDDWQSKVNAFITHWVSERNLALVNLDRSQKRQLIEALYLEGAFEARSAADYISRVLSVGRATVFNYLRKLRAEQ